MNSPPATVTDPPALDDDTLADLAVDLLDAVLGAAEVDAIGVANWWPRATTALQTGAATGDCVRTVVTRMCAKLQITVALPEKTTAVVVTVDAALADQRVFARWRRIAERDAVFIAALVRLRRAERRDATKTKAAARRPTITDDTEGPLF